jgi:hypothetical protein
MFPRDYKCWRKRSDCWVDFEPGTSWKFPGLHTYSDLITALQVSVTCFGSGANDIFDPGLRQRVLS